MKFKQPFWAFITKILPIALFAYLVYTGIKLWFFPFLIGFCLNVLLSSVYSSPFKAFLYIKSNFWLVFYPLAASLALISTFGLFFRKKWSQAIWVFFSVVEIFGLISGKTIGLFREGREMQKLFDVPIDYVLLSIIGLAALSALILLLVPAVRKQFN